MTEKSSELLAAAKRYLDWTTMSVDDYEAKYPDTPGDNSPRQALRAAIANMETEAPTTTGGL